ncbi:MAG: hypothetical protein M1834_004883 [Cirrosporium novae-zelandiae]|nr:MAG: hypothetical protein M1834_004883 [Cirrosporium novae-zelandiae]
MTMSMSTVSPSSASTSSVSSSSMDMDMMSMSDMTMTFFTSTVTPLYSNAWAPDNAGKYAGTCIFLIVLAVVFRGLLGLRGLLEAYWVGMGGASRYVARNMEEADDGSGEDRGKGGFAAVNSMSGREDKWWSSTPWRINVDGSRALLDMVLVGMSYLLMIAVMTMNVGYFMSILGGTFLGSLIFGRYSGVTQH